MMKYYVVMDLENSADVKEYIFHAPNIKAIQTFFKNQSKIFMAVDLTRANLPEDDVRLQTMDVYELPSGECTAEEFEAANPKYYAINK